MIKVIVAVKDTAIQAFATPFTVPASAAAVRSLRDEVNNPSSESDVRKHPEDFELYALATFSESTGEIVANESGPVLICRAKDLIDTVQS